MRTMAWLSGMTAAYAFESDGRVLWLLLVLSVFLWLLSEAEAGWPFLQEIEEDEG